MNRHTDSPRSFRPLAATLIAAAGLAFSAGAAPLPLDAAFESGDRAIEQRPAAAPGLLLRTGTVDTARLPAHLAGDGTLAAQVGAHAPGTRFVIQLDGPITPERRARMVDAGITVGPYLPMHAYIVTLDDADPRAVLQLDFIRWHSVYQNAWKLDPDLGNRPYQTPERQALVTAGRDYIVVSIFPGVDPAIVQQAILNIAGGRDVQPPVIIAAARSGSPNLGGTSTDLYIEMSIADIPALATIPGVQYVEPASDIETRAARNDNSRWVIQSNQVGVTPLYTAGLRGEGQIVGVLDTAVRQDHCSFHDPANPVGPNHRKIVAYNTAPGSASHGTHVAASIVGDAGSNTGNTRGIAYLGRLAYNSWGSSPFNDIYQRFATHHTQGARIHSNSWGDDGTTAYNALCRNIDLFQWEQEDSLTLWAVTNTANLRNPENCKNTLAIGATRVPPEQHLHGFGGTGPTSDGRRKPEVYAPGRNTNSASSSTTCGTSSLGGTSMACPVAAGVGMLVRQYFMDGYYPVGMPAPGTEFTPSSALVKAMLVNSAQDMTGVTGYPSNQEGWGRILADSTIFLTGDDRKLNVYDVPNAEGLTTAGQTEYLLPVLGSDEQLRVTLVWTEPPATAGASFAAVNDLDLEVSDPTGILYRGNVFNTSTGQSIPGGSRDDRNNVEQVHIANPTPGLWTVRVRGTAVNQAAQGYALVMTGDIMPAEPPSLILVMPDPVPYLVAPGEPYTLRLRILEGAAVLVPGSARLHYRAGASGPFSSVPMTLVSGDVYAADLPAHACGDAPQFYFSAEADDNTTVHLPQGAPDLLFSTNVGVIVPQPVLETSFTVAWPQGWSATGMWHVTSGCTPPVSSPCAEAPHAYYGRAATCNYNLPTGANSGNLVAPEVSLPAIPPTGAIMLRFCYALETENHPNFDRAELFVNGQTRPEWRLPDVAPTPTEPDRYWATAEINLSEFAGQNISLSWRFNTVTSANNIFRGWHINNIRLTADSVGCESTCYANCDASTTAPVLNIDDFTCFINAFALGQALPHAQQITHYANCDGSTTAPVLNIDDFSCFINAFALGCP